MDYAFVHEISRNTLPTTVRIDLLGHVVRVHVALVNDQPHKLSLRAHVYRLQLPRLRSTQKGNGRIQATINTAPANTRGGLSYKLVYRYLELAALVVLEAHVPEITT